MEEQTILLDQIEQLNIKNNSLGEELRDSREQNEALTELLKQRDGRISRLESQLNELLRRIYGRKSEKLDPNQLLLDSILLEAQQQVADKTIESQEEKAGIGTLVKEHTRTRRKRLELPEHLERINHELDVAEEEKVCLCCQQEMSRIGEDVTERLGYQPSQLKVNRYIRPKYACKNKECEGSGVKQIEALESPLGRCEAESSLLAHIIVEKFEHHNPLYRQQIRFEQLGVGLNRMTMSGWMAKCAYVLKPLYQLMKERIISYDIVLNDDTPVEMLEPGNGKTRKTRLWCSVGGENLQYILYNFTRGRSRDGPEEFFEHYQGYLVADAYAGYERMFKGKKIIHSGCWAHARRYFVKAQESAAAQATEILVYIAQLYRIEKAHKHSSAKERLAARQKYSVKILGKIKEKLCEQRQNALPRSPLGEAIDYTLRQWESLMRYTTDGRLPIDNNRVEQSIRPVALGRKNWLFVGSENGGHTAAVLMSFCASCRKLKINTWEYLTDVLERINDCRMSQLESLLPDNWQQLRAKVK
ncbi:MAG: IS66 family transposase [Candidatus Omnitrophica bacterium]|nr:IS66 family transposase [Candidatus Omnitrophota bacterium]